MADKTGPLGPNLNLVGVVSEYAASEQAGEQVVQFVVASDQADIDPIAVELRGEKLNGVVRNRHRVALVAPDDLDKLEDRTLRPLRFKNLTTGGLVSVERPGLRRKALRAGISTFKEAWKVTVGILIGALLVTLGITTSTAAIHTGGPYWPALVVMEILWLLIVAGLALTLYRRWRWSGGRLPVLELLAVLIGGTLFVAASWWSIFG